MPTPTKDIIPHSTGCKDERKDEREWQRSQGEIVVCLGLAAYFRIRSHGIFFFFNSLFLAGTQTVDLI